MRLLSALCAATMLVLNEPAEAGILDLGALADSLSEFVTSLTRTDVDHEVIMPPRGIDRKMVLTPPSLAAPIRNILPRGSGPLLQN